MAKLKEKEENINYKNFNLKIDDIYLLLKNYDFDTLITLINNRNSIKKNLNYEGISTKCSKNNLFEIELLINNI